MPDMSRIPTRGLPVLALALLLASCGPRDVQSPEALAGHWQGSIAWRDATVPVDLDVERSGDGFAARFTAPELLLRDVPVEAFIYASPKVRFQVPVGGETWAFDGWFRRNLLVGACSGGSLPRTMNRAQLPQLGLRRLAKPPDPYAADTVRFAGGAASLAGTVYAPVDSVPHPAVLLLPSPDDDSRAAGRELADRFARAGFVVLAYDPRGRGASAGSPAPTLGELELDAVEALEFLRRRPGVDPERVGLLGRSVGALLVPRVATRVRTAFALAISPPGVPLRELFGLRGGLLGRLLRERAPAWAAADLDADPAAAWSALAVPGRVYYGERDDEAPSAASAGHVRAALEAGARAEARVEMVPRADHALRLRIERGEPFDFPRAAPGGLDSLLAWARRTAGLPPAAVPLVPQPR